MRSDRHHREAVPVRAVSAADLADLISATLAVRAALIWVTYLICLPEVVVGTAMALSKEPICGMTWKSLYGKQPKVFVKSFLL